MAQCSLMLVFPEYSDPAVTPTADEWRCNALPPDDSLGDWVKELAGFVDFFKDESCVVMYDSKNAQACVYPMEQLPDEYPSRAFHFRKILNGEDVKDWRRGRVSASDREYRIQIAGRHGIVSVKDEVRAEAAERLFVREGDTCLLATHIPGYGAKDWTVNNGQGEVADVRSMPLSVAGVFGWLSENRRPARVYNWNPKHGENGCGGHPSNKGAAVSLLLCSRGEAASLMKKAVGEEEENRLYAFDTQRGGWMEYMAEAKSPNANSDERKYHSYHIDDGKCVPKRVKEKLGRAGEPQG